MRHARMGLNPHPLSHRLYVKPESLKECAALWVRGYRKWPHGIIAYQLWVHSKHKVTPDEPPA